MLLKVWALTLVFGTSEYSGNGESLTSQKYIYTTAAECQVWQKFWQPRPNVRTAQCTQDHVIVPK